MPTVATATALTHFIISKGTKKDVIIPAPIYAEGQTSGEWVSLGTYTLQKGNSTSVIITTKNTDGVVTRCRIVCA